MTQSLVFIFAAAIAALLSFDRKAYAAANGNSSPMLFDRKLTDSLRGIAIIMVIIGHIGSAMGCQPVGTLGSFGVALFLFLSGYGINESFKKNGLKNYWGKKLKRVWLPYAIVISTLGLYIYDFTVGDYLLNIACLKTEYWFVAFLVKWYIAFWLFTKFCPKYRMALMTAFGLLVLFFFGRLPGEQAFCFVAGVAASVYYDKLKTINRKNLMLTASIGIAICGMVWFLKDFYAIADTFEPGSWQMNSVKTLIKMSACVGIVAAAHALPSISYSRVLFFMGTLSYELYLLHYPFYTMIDGSIAKAAMMVAGAIAGAVLLNMTLKKIDSRLTTITLSAK